MSVWFRRPLLPIPSNEITDPINFEFAISESQIALEGIWKTLNCFWISNPDNLRKAENKIYQLSVARKIGFTISPTIVTNIPIKAKEFFTQTPQNIIYKPLRRGRVIRKGKLNLIYSNLVSLNMIKKLNNVKYASSLFQHYIEKYVEIRATVIGKRVFTVAIHSQESPLTLHDWRRGEASSLHHEIHKLPNDVESKCIVLVQNLGLEFGAIDLILTPEGEYCFLEINPNGQWAWIQQLIPEIPLRETLADLLISRGKDL